jgi:signal transduction histidine kinase/DNA-binding response OmpR family regulator/HAMP domain-containing protein
MKISNLFKIGLIITIALFIMVAFAERQLLLSEKQQRNALSNKGNLEALGRQLANGSDYLTNEIRRYAQFGDDRHFKNFWKEVNETKSREIESDLLKYNVLPEEIEFIKKSKFYSDSLISTEAEAMQAIKRGDLDVARKLVFGEYYDQQKNLIMENIKSFQEAISKRTAGELQRAQDKTTFYFFITNLLLGVCGLFVLFGFYFLGLKKLVRPISQISQVISNFSNSSFFSTIPHGNRNDEIGILSSAFNQLIAKREALETELRNSNITLESLVKDKTKQLETEKELYKVLLSSTQIKAYNEGELKKGLEFLLKDICIALNWSVAHIYFVDGSGEKLISQDIWYTSDKVKFEEFILISNKSNFKKGEGLPGRVWESKESLWIRNVLTDQNFPRAKIVQNLDLKAAFGVPIILKEKVFAILEFFSELQKEPDLKVISLLENIANQITKVFERLEYEKLLLEAKTSAEKANLAKSLFLASMSHEIRTPMHAVLGYSQILLRDKSLKEDTLNSIRTIDNSGKNLLKMINEILDISKIEAGKMELHKINFCLNVLIDEISSLFELRCKQKQLRWTVNESPKQTLVQGDETKLRQVLINLLGNAIKFTESGEVKLSITQLENNQYRFDIIDSGHGISVENQNSVFEAFNQEGEGFKKGGTGLGLAISKKQLQLMGSDLFLKSEINKGSQFYFTLTLLKANKEDIIDRKEKHGNILRLDPKFQVKALIVDDVNENRDVLSKLLLSINVETELATNGKEGVEKTKEYNPEIIFMDIRMPLMGGEDAIKAIHEEFGKDRFKIVAITADAIGQRRDHYMSMGFHEYITKPFQANEVYEALRKLLDVEFVYEKDEIPQKKSSSLEEIDFSQFSIPEDLFTLFEESAELFNITVLQKILDELEQRKEIPSHMLEYLRNKVVQYDMDAILKFLKQVSKNK